jgi:uncharacterized membrane protein YhhN
MVAPFCNDKNASAFAVGLCATSNVAAPNTVTSVLFICAAMAASAAVDRFRESIPPPL